VEVPGVLGRLAAALAEERKGGDGLGEEERVLGVEL